MYVGVPTDPPPPPPRWGARQLTARTTDPQGLGQSRGRVSPPPPRGGGGGGVPPKRLHTPRDHTLAAGSPRAPVSMPADPGLWSENSAPTSYMMSQTAYYCLCLCHHGMLLAATACGCTNTSVPLARTMKAYDCVCVCVCVCLYPKKPPNRPPNKTPNRPPK